MIVPVTLALAMILDPDANYQRVGANRQIPDYHGHGRYRPEYQHPILCESGTPNPFSGGSHLVGSDAFLVSSSAIHPNLVIWVLNLPASAYHPCGAATPG